MRLRRLSILAATILLLLPARPRVVRGDAVEVLSADQTGVTLRVRTAGYRLAAGGPDGRAELTAGDFGLLDQPGRPRLPYAPALVALPPGARAVARIVGDEPEETLEGIHLGIGEAPGFEPGPEGSDETPVSRPVAPILDGPWPVSPVVVGEPFTLRRQRMVAVRLQPFRADEASGRLFVRRSLTVRIDFVGGAPAAAPAPEDIQWDPVLRSALANFEQGRAWREPRPPSVAGPGLFAPPLVARAPGEAAAPGFDEDQPEVRVRIDSTGVYWLDYDRLVALGYSAGIRVEQVSVHRHEFLEDQSPPYGTVELPIEVEDYDHDGVFGPGDRIVVFVRSWAERSGASWAQRAWGDAEVIYVTSLGARNGLRVASRSGWRGLTGLTPLASCPWTERWERSFSYMNFPNDTLTDQFHWTSIALYYSRPDTIRFATNHLDTTRQVTFSVAWQGRKAEAHYTWARVRNGLGQYTSVVDSAYWVGKIPYTATATLHGSALSEGLNNRLGVFGKTTNPLPPIQNPNESVYAGLNWFQATYWRRFRALQGYLSCNSGDAEGVYELNAEGFSDSVALRAYDLTDPANPVRLTGAVIQKNGSEYSLSLQDSVATGGRTLYAVFDTPRIPPADHFGAVIRRQLTVRTTGDYLLVVPEAFQSAGEQLAAFRRSQQGGGLAVVLAPLEAVNDEFNGGRHSSWAIRRFVRYALNHWDSRFLLLVGDGSEDGQHLLNTSGTDWVPAQKVPSPVGVSEGHEIMPSDAWYGLCLNGCTLDQPRVPELSIGRLPVHGPSEASGVVQKIIAYENFASDPAWRRELLLLADDTFSGAGLGVGGTSDYCNRDYEIRFLQLSQRIASVVQDTAGLRQMNPEVFDLGYYLRNEPVNPSNCRPSMIDTQSRTHASVTPQLLSRLNAGRMWWNFQGHANLFVMTHEYVFRKESPTDDDVLALQNDGRPFLLTAFSCHLNAFAGVKEGDRSYGSGIAEQMANLPGGGAIASWASSGYESIPRNGREHINVTLARAMFADPPHDDILGDKGARVVLGEAIRLALLRYVSFAETCPICADEAGIGISYCLLGDPATRISVGAPQILVTANGQPVTDGQPVRLGTQGDTLRLEADLVSNVQITGITLTRARAALTDTVPPADYTLTPAFPDTARLGRGGRAYHLIYRTTLGNTQRYTLFVTDRYRLDQKFDVVFPFETVLRGDGVPLRDDDRVAPNANLTLLVLSPNPIVPDVDCSLTVNGVPQAFTADSTRGDHSGRQWEFAWSHERYPPGRYQVALSLGGVPSALHYFQVEDRTRFENAMAFPNPFEDDLGTRFIFTLDSDSPADVLLRVYTVSGRLVYERTERGLLYGYHELAWDGRDAEGYKLANGVYLYRLVARNASKSIAHEGRLVKLRRPRRAVEPTSP